MDIANLFTVECSDEMEHEASGFGRSTGGRNTTEEPVRILMLSTQLAPEILEYPDSGKVATVDARGEGLFQTRYGKPVGYWDGES